MRYSRVKHFLVALSLVLVIAAPALSGGCTEGSISGITAEGLAATMVPPVDLDVYVYVNQQVPTVVPGSLTGAPVDISVQSLAIWGIVNSETQYAVSGALTFTSAADAGAVFAQIPKLADTYTKLSDRTIYFVQGSGGPAESIKNAIVNNNLKQYDDKAALLEVSGLPSGGTTKPGLIGVVKPTRAAVNLVKEYLDQNTAATIESVFSNAKPRVIVFGVFSSKPLNVADMAGRIKSNTVWEMDLGVAVSMDSVYPGFIFSPVANWTISRQGLPQVKVGELDAYKQAIQVGGKAISIYLAVGGNHVYVTASGNDAYAQTLLTSIAG